MRRTSIAKHYQIIDLKESHCIINVASSTQLGIPISTVKNIWRWHIKEMGVWCIVLYRDFFKSSQRQNWAAILMATWNRAQSSGWLNQHWMRLLWRGGPHQPKNGTAPIVMWWLPRLSWTQSWVCSITMCVTKLILNCRHWDQSLHSYPLIISLQGPSGNPVFEHHRSPSPNYESLPGFLQWKRCWHNALALTGDLIRALMITSMSIMRLELRSYGWYQQCGLILYSPRESVEYHALSCHSVVGSKKLSDVCSCYWSRQRIK